MIHDEHPSNGVLTQKLRDALLDLNVRARPPLEAIVDRGRAHRRRQTGGLATLGVLAVVASGALVLGLTGIHNATRKTPSTQIASVSPGAIRTAAFTLVSYTNGTVKLTLTNSQVFDPTELRRALANDGIPALVKRNIYCSSDPAPPDPNAIGVLSTTLPPGFPHARGFLKPQMAHTPRLNMRPLINHTVTVIDHKKMPSGTELAFDYAPGQHLLSVNLVYTNSHTCRSGQPPAH